MKTHLKNLIQIITTDSPAEVKLAQKQVEKFWHDFYIPHREEGRLAFAVFWEEIENFEQIKDAEHQAYFINTLKWPLYAAGEENFEFIAEFFLKYIQHPSGKIRQAIIRAADYLIYGLILDAGRYHRDLVKPGVNLQELVARDKRRFGILVMIAERLAEKYFEPKFKRYKYISSLPAGVYKSLEIFIAENLLRSEYYEKVYAEYKNDRLQRVLPQLKFKYTVLGADTMQNGFLCFVCKKQKTRLGSTNINSRPPQLICEDCAIDQYQIHYGYKTREAAAARRRRIFDVGYLFQEILVDKYLLANNKSTINELTEEEMRKLFVLGKDLYNELFSSEGKIMLEEMFEQQDIENKINKVLDKLEINWWLIC